MCKAKADLHNYFLEAQGIIFLQYSCRAIQVDVFQRILIYFTNDKGLVPENLLKIFNRMASDTSEKEIIDSSLIQDRKERCQESSNEGSTEEIQLVQHEQSARTSNSEAGEAIPKTQIAPEHHSKFNSNASEAPDVTPLSGKEPANIGVCVDITNNFGIVIVCDNSQITFEPGNTIDELITKIQNTECINEEPKPITFNRKQLQSH
ncbi:Hypothetical predicted protein [Paramuricea clavata]|uniref:Uncharacterized protein n=1 Tax=Paramuricea clavata TaxID=317549 RepID=A0A6S7H3A7_PARCT|nr:Hypothetical predicted protein [Paramuricea clavata]